MPEGVSGAGPRQGREATAGDGTPDDAVRARAAAPERAFDAEAAPGGELRGYVDEPPTIPPASAATGGIGLRWASQPRAPRRQPPRQGPVLPGEAREAETRRLNVREVAARQAEARAGQRGRAEARRGEPSRGDPNYEEAGYGEAGYGEVGPPTGDADGAPGASGPGRRSRAKVVLSVLVAVVVVAGAAVAVAVWRATDRASDGTPAPVSLAKAAPATAFSDLLAQSGAARQLLVTATSRACAVAYPDAAPRQGLIAQLDRAGGVQAQILSELRVYAAKLARLPDAPELVAALASATVAAMAADHAYAAWLQDLQATGCYSAPTNDWHYLTAGHDSSAAAVEQGRLGELWRSAQSFRGVQAQ